MELGVITGRSAGLILLAMIFARTAAMGFNRWMDASLDAKNPRTSGRAIPSGRLPAGSALTYSAISSLLFMATAFQINMLCGRLSPLALLVILGYSTAKRWTSWSHVILGLSLAMAPAGGWLAITGEFHLILFLLSGAVLCWVAGFDILYALMDIDFDRSAGLYSIPSRFGKEKAYGISRILHGVCILILLIAGREMFAGFGWYLAVTVVALCLLCEQILVRDPAKIPIAFFHLNASIGFILLAGFVIDL